jgi:septum site-determining protein MinC
MSKTPPSRRTIEFRNASIGATVAVLRETRPDLLADELHKMLGGRPDFFSGEAAILDFSDLGNPPERIDWAGLLSLFRRFQLQPIGVCRLPEEHAAAARQAGLAQLDGALNNAPAATPRPATRAEPAPRPQPAAEPTRPAPAATAGSTMFVDRPVRSGQQVYARDADLVLLAGMSNGAEVIADGSIHCYGPLRGRALAGAQGNDRARIMATNFGPEIVSIAGVYRTFDQGLPAAIAGKPALVRLSGDKGNTLTIEPLQLD